MDPRTPTETQPEPQLKTTPFAKILEKSAHWGEEATRALVTARVSGTDHLEINAHGPIGQLCVIKAHLELIIQEKIKTNVTTVPL